MKRLILIAITMIFSSALVHAYDYENQRSKQARDSGKLLTEPKQKEIQSKKQKTNKIKLRDEKRRKNLEKRKINRSMGIVNKQSNIKDVTH